MTTTTNQPTNMATLTVNKPSSQYKHIFYQYYIDLFYCEFHQHIYNEHFVDI